MIHNVSLWLLVAAFVGAGVINALGLASTREGFARWGYRGWWHWLTGGLEIVSAVLIAFPATRIAGLVLGALIIAAAILTVLRYREFQHLVPLGVFVVLIALAATTF